MNGFLAKRTAYPDFSEKFPLLAEPDLSTELSQLSHPEPQTLRGIAINSVTLQPCLAEAQRSQD